MNKFGHDKNVNNYTFSTQNWRSFRMEIRKWMEYQITFVSLSDCFYGGKSGVYSSITLNLLE